MRIGLDFNVPFQQKISYIRNILGEDLVNLNVPQFVNTESP